ncbi:MAG: DUF3187 family protein [Deltaproteobacteria bacterium]|nr:DUF3187 family protein [Deltaproteobacteria bacterium]
MENRLARARALPDGWETEPRTRERTGARRALYHRRAGGRQREGLLLWALACALLPTLARAEPAPLGARNLAPQHLFLLDPGPDLPERLAPGKTRLGIDLAYASIFTNRAGSNSDALLDMEVARADLRYALGVGRMEVEFDLPLLWTGAGLFDSVINSYHDAFNFPTGGRNTAPENRFAYRIRRGARAFDPKPGAGLGDAVLSVKSAVGSRRDLAARALVKLPTGSRSRGFGSEHADASVGLLGDARAGWFRFWGNLDAVYVGGSPDPALRLGSHWALAAGGTAALDVGRGVDVQLELHYFSSPYDTGLRALDRDPVLFALGVARSFGGLRASFGMTEDVAVETSPDIALFLNLAWTGEANAPPR